MIPKISILLPTRGRPDQAQRLFESIAEHSDNLEQIEIILRLDDDDTISHALEPNLITHKKIIGPRASMGTLNTECYQQSSGQIIILLNDDMAVRTPGWDAKIRATHERFADEIYLAYANDMIAGELLCHIPILSRKTCEALVRPFPQEYQGGFIDYHLFDIFKRLRHAGKDRVIYLNSVEIEHMHFRVGKSSYDATYSARGQMDVGDEAFTGLRKYRQVASKRLQAVIENESLPPLPALRQFDSPPQGILHALFRYAIIFLLDTGLPLKWRANLFRVFNERYLRNRFGWYPPIPAS
jgi:glycosyltransferase involved in cell wall biosynthesis